jgi:hypothetical protein
MNENCFDQNKGNHKIFEDHTPKSKKPIRHQTRKKK